MAGVSNEISIDSQSMPRPSSSSGVTCFRVFPGLSGQAGEPSTLSFEQYWSDELSFTLGERKPRTGFQGRCRYPFEREILTHLLDSISRSKGHWGFDSVAGMKLAPLVSIPVSPLDSTHIPATVYNRFAKLKKSRR